ncbi:hypothetical protein [Kitasatospora viridis]|uniref:Uncharacterized protein n=1 Tax=Kitasatospora viridis TaxID=281105 RepID=A0A561UEN2_9ACTN|nr:hypothetical protein [Kitasatospora viridis]TWF97847.1 hypothetical protein FHX73_111648 [Kitasatospora viridis]
MRADANRSSPARGLLPTLMLIDLLASLQIWLGHARHHGLLVPAFLITTLLWTVAIPVLARRSLPRPQLRRAAALLSATLAAGAVLFALSPDTIVSADAILVGGSAAYAAVLVYALRPKPGPTD